MNIFKFEFKRNLKSLIYWSLGTCATIVVFMSLFPSMKDMGMQELVGSKLEALPPALLEIFNFSSITDFSKINDYMGYTFQYIAMAFGIYGVTLGVNSIIQEESEGTIEFLYSKPVSRSKILWSKILSIAITFFAFSIIVGLVTVLISLAVKPEDLETMTLVMDIKGMFIGMALLGYIFMAVGIVISTALKKGKAATSIGVASFFGTYILGIMGKLKEEFDFMLYLSPFDWFIPSNILKDGFELKYIIIAFVIIIVSLLAASFVYRRKDFN